MNFKKILFLWAALLVTAVTFAQVKKKPAPAATHKTTPTAAKQQAMPAVAGVLPTDPEVITGKLPNGLTYYIRANGQPKGKANLVLVNKVGSVLETDAQQGLANLTQHMAFRGTRDFSKQDINSYLKSLGAKFGPDSNAYTSYDETVYELQLPTDTQKIFESGFSLLANWAAYMKFDPAQVNEEKALLAAQARLGGKTAQERLQLQTLPVLLNNSIYSQRLPIGKESTINTFTDATLKIFYSQWYRPDLQAVIAVGDFDPKKVEEMIKFNFSSLRNPTPEKPQPQFTAVSTPGTAVKFFTDKDYPYTLVQFISKHPHAGLKTPVDYMQSIRILLFNQMLSGRVTELSQVAAPPLLYGQMGYGGFAGKQDAFTAIAVARPGGFENAVKAMVNETQRARQFGFTTTELERAKQNALAQIANVYDAKANTPSSNYIGEYERNFLNGQAIPGMEYEYNYYINNISKITLDEMNALAARFISDQNRVILVQAPDSEKDKLPTEQILLKWVAEAEKTATPYIDYRSNPLMTKAPVAGKVVSRTTDSTLLVENIVLSNGVKIILKPTSFANNQILFTGFSFGGTSLASNQDITSANFASTAIPISGVAGFNQMELSKMIQGKNFSVSPYIGDFAQGVSGYASLDDFETAMQLLNLYFTNPRKDEAIWKNLISQSKSLVAGKVNDPGSVYQDTIMAVLNNYNPRMMPATVAQLDAATLDKAYEFYKQRFADASGFTFTFTGSFTNDNIIPFLETYLGSLPSTNSKETYKNLGVHPPTGQITKTVYKGASDKASVQLIYTGSYDYNEANNVQMDALEEVLNIRLVDSIKTVSGVFSPGVRISYLKVPDGQYKVTISFLCDAANVDSPVNYILNEISKLKQTGPVAKDVQNFIYKEARSLQGQLKQNAYWEASLSGAAQNGQDPDRILNHVQDLNDVTAQSVKYAANKYLGNNLIKLILLPEKK